MIYRQMFLCATLCFGLLGWSRLSADEIPAAAQKSPIALVGGTVHPVSGPAIEGGTVLFADGKIVAVGKDVKLPAGTEEISVVGKHVYPGLFESHSQMGLTEFASIPASIDSYETGSINPNVKANVAVNPDSALIPVTRANGVLVALTAPTSGRISGQAAVIQLDGWTYEDLTLNADAGMIINWPGGQRRGRRGRGAEAEASDPLEEIKDLLDQAKDYASLRKADPDRQPLDLRLEALTKLVERKLPVIAAADTLEQIESAVGFAARENLRLIILGGYDAEECAALLKKHNVPVIITSTHRLPQYRSDQYDASYTLPARLQAAGILFAISGSGRSETWNSRNLPYHAATAAAFGLTPEQAIRSITLSPAEIFGVADRIGSLEEKKDATLFVANGNPLEIQTQVEMAFVQGRKIDLSSKHVRLWEKYKTKYEQQQEAAGREDSDAAAPGAPAAPNAPAAPATPAENSAKAESSQK